ncbi:MAG: ribonuclease HII [Rhodospirillales bacterium]|nr:ribonuclease HII [Alphaproteobacteria bacterium]MCB9980968.1 ribonuclease HII [Rhodospirillales bacterium]
MPDFSLENDFEGPVCGLDEVGRGPLAGPVVAACVYIPDELRALPFVCDIRDSKTLSEKKLAALYEQITTHFVWATGEKSPSEIDKINILQASLKAMAAALDATTMPYVHALIDGNKIPANLSCPATAVVKGDAKSVSIAAASIVAKVTRDRLMRALHEQYPHYGWDSNVGYPSKAHLAGIDAHGITEHHRKSFGPVKNFIAFGSTRKPLNSAA